MLKGATLSGLNTCWQEQMQQADTRCIEGCNPCSSTFLPDLRNNYDLRAMKKPLKIAKRRSKIHGNGVIATARIRKGEDIVEYKGRIISHDEADEQYYGDVGSGHTFLFTLNEEWIVDANVRGNVAKWINTGCDPNAVAFIHSEKKKNPDPKKDRVIIEALRVIEPGEEIIYDYGFAFDVPYTKKLLKIWECRCGSPKCTGSMLKLKESADKNVNKAKVKK